MRKGGRRLKKFVCETEYFAKKKAIFWAVDYFREYKYENDVPVEIIWKDMYGTYKAEILNIRREALNVVFMVEIVDAQSFLDNSNLKLLTKNEILESWTILRKYQIKRRFDLFTKLKRSKRSKKSTKETKKRWWNILKKTRH